VSETLAETVQRMGRLYRQTGTFRGDDLARVLGDPRDSYRHGARRPLRATTGATMATQPNTPNRPNPPAPSPTPPPAEAPTR
jgi:hypothetical protein